MRRTVLLSAVVALLAGGCRTMQAEPPAEPEPGQPAPPPPNASHIPAGTLLVGTLMEDLSARTTRVGDAFTIAVQHALVAENRETVVPAGAVITGLVTGVGAVNGQSAIRLNFTRVGIDDASHPFTATITSTRPADAASADAPTTAADAPSPPEPGAVIGEGELRSAFVAGPFGAGAGTIISLGAGADAVLRSGTQITLQTAERIDLGPR